MNRNSKNDHLLNEDDIGSGEKTPGQEETEKLIEQVGQRPKNGQGKDRSGSARSDERERTGR